MNSYEDHMNEMATDILDCPECSSEDLTNTASSFDEETEVTTDSCHCSECDHKFETTN